MIVTSCDGDENVEEIISGDDPASIKTYIENPLKKITYAHEGKIYKTIDFGLNPSNLEIVSIANGEKNLKYRFDQHDEVIKSEGDLDYDLVGVLGYSSATNSFDKRFYGIKTNSFGYITEFSCENNSFVDTEDGTKNIQSLNNTSIEYDPAGYITKIISTTSNDLDMKTDILYQFIWENGNIVKRSVEKDVNSIADQIFILRSHSYCDYNYEEIENPGISFYDRYLDDSYINLFATVGLLGKHSKNLPSSTFETFSYVTDPDMLSTTPLETNYSYKFDSNNRVQSIEVDSEIDSCILTYEYH